VTTILRRHDVHSDGNLGPRTWREPSTEAMFWMLVAVYGTIILTPLAVIALYVIARVG
jgi:hypothetical protein